VIPMERFSEVMALLVLILVKNMKWHLDGHKSLEYQFEGYWELFFDENVKNTKWHLVGHKRLKYQFEGYWEPFLCEEHEVTSGWSQKGLNFNLRVNENSFSKNSFYLHE
jgi:hypothetical protein